LGHKVHPNGFRLGVVRGWQSRWYAERDYKDILAEDFKIRRIIGKELANASVSQIEIERTAADQVLVKVHTARPGIVIGKNGDKVDKLRALLEDKTKKRRVRMDIVEIRQPELDAFLVGRSIAEQLEKRVSFRRAMKQAIQKSMRANAKGIKIICAGRLGGAEIARTEKEVDGSVPLHTLRADIDYGQTEAHTTFGVIGIKVYIYKGDILPSKRRELAEQQVEAAAHQNNAPRGGRADDRRGNERRGRNDRPPVGGDRAPRAPGDRPRGGDRGPRPAGDIRPAGDRPQRPPRPAGDRPVGERSPRPAGGDRGPRPAGEARPAGDRPQRPPRQPRPEQAAPASSESTTTPTPAPAPETGATQSE
jgi:small subunit ribosomal protein S3